MSRGWKIRREVVFLAVPPVVLFTIASTSDIGIGFRHLFPIFPLLYILIAGCVAYFVAQKRTYAYVFGVLLLWQVVEPFAARAGAAGIRE